MKVAVFTPYLPYPPDTGGKIRSYYLLEALAERFQVDLYTVSHGQDLPRAAVEALEEHCHRVISFRLRPSWKLRDRIWRALSPLPRSVYHFYSSGSLAWARAHLQVGGYDAVVADELCMTPYAELASRVPRLVTRQKVDYLHYREVARARAWGLEKILDLIEARQLQRYERVKMGLYDGYLACSEDDVAQIRPYAPDVPALVIANGADLRKFIPSRGPRVNPPTLLYVGSMDYYPNIDAVQFFFEQIYPPIREAMPEVRMQVVGHRPPPSIQALDRLPGVEVTGSVPDVWPYYDRATTFVVPLRLGGGTRLKIIEAMAMEVPVVSTSVGAEGLDIHPGEDILIADDAASFTESVLRLLADPQLREGMGARGRRLARRYDWREITRSWADLVQEVITRRNGEGP